MQDLYVFSCVHNGFEKIFVLKAPKVSFQMCNSYIKYSYGRI